MSLAHGIVPVDGREIMPMKESQIVEQCKLIKSKGLKNVGVQVFLVGNAELNRIPLGRNFWHIFPFG